MPAQTGRTAPPTPAGPSASTTREVLCGSCAEICSSDGACLRDQLLPAGEREENIPCDLSDTAWFQRIDASGGAVFFAAGVFYYFLKDPSVSGFFRFLARVGDNRMNMQIVKLGFGDGR